MENNWVDFRAIKSVVTMEMILGRYGVNWLRKSGEELRGRCPIHQGEGQSTFHASLSKNAFNCFSCKARGNVLDFVAAMEKCSVREAGAKLVGWFSISATLENGSVKPAANEDRGAESPLVNKPLAFQLKGIDHEHPYLKDRGITLETAQTFGVGFFCGRGSMSGRVVIPIHDERGELVAYAGRSIDDSEPRYKLPAGFHKSQVVYNLYKAGESDRVVVVEGFFDCMKVVQAGFPAVALMGSSLSEQQEIVLLRQFKKVTLLMDGDGAGREAAETIAKRLVRKLFVRIVGLADGKQPDELSEGQLREVLG